jgi:hypothetical protein
MYRQVLTHFISPSKSTQASSHHTAATTVGDNQPGEQSKLQLPYVNMTAAAPQEQVLEPKVVSGSWRTTRAVHTGWATPISKHATSLTHPHLSASIIHQTDQQATSPTALVDDQDSIA